MQTASAEVTQQAFLGAAGKPFVRNPADANLIVEFRLAPVRNDKLSDGYYDPEQKKQVPGAGRDIFEDKVFVRIMIPGDKTQINDGQAWISRNPGDFGADNIRFPGHYAAFLASGATPIIGTPLLELTKGQNPVLRPSQVKELEFFNCRTCEQLVAMPEVNAANFMDFQNIKRAVVEYLKIASANAPAQAAHAEIQAMRAETDYLRQQLKEQGDRLEALMASRAETIDSGTEAPAPAKRGRPKKVAEAA